MSTIRLAMNIGAEGGATRTENFERAVNGHADAPALLVSFVYLDRFLKNQAKYVYRDWALDSGAFSAHQSGTEIKLQDYIDTAKRLLESDPTLTEVFALDVIGDEKASLQNCEEMWRQGVPAIPTFHIGEPEEFLKHIAANYPKIALGGVALLRGHAKLKWAEQCFARVYPKRIHGFGFGSKSHVLALPWHSVDASNWEFGPCAFGRWNSYGKMSVRGSNQNLKTEVDFYLRLERQARAKWRHEMARLGALPGGSVVRLSHSGNQHSGAENTLMQSSPNVRLAFTNVTRERVFIEP